MADWTRGGAQPRLFTRPLVQTFVIASYRVRAYPAAPSPLHASSCPSLCCPRSQDLKQQSPSMTVTVSCFFQDRVADCCLLTPFPSAMQHKSKRCTLAGEEFHRTCFLFLRKVDRGAVEAFQQVATEILGF